MRAPDSAQSFDPSLAEDETRRALTGNKPRQNPQSMKNTFKGLSRYTLLLAFSSFFSDISTEMLYPVLPVFLTETLKAPASIIGIIEGLSQGIQYGIQGFSGFLADKFEKRKSIALYGYALSALSKPFIGIATAWPAVLLGRFSDRLGAGTRSAPRDALVAGSAQEQYRGKAFGLEGIGDNAGAFVGPLIAIALLFFLKINIRKIFYLAFIPGAVAFFLVTFVKERKVAAEHKVIKLNLKLFPKSYWKYILVTAIFGLGNSSNAYLILRAKNAGIPLITTIFIYALFNLVAALSSYPSGSLSDTMGRKNILLFAFVIYAVTYFGFAQSTNSAVLGILFLLYGIYYGIFRAVGKSFASDFVQQNQRATAIGFYSTVIGITTLIASVVAGQLWTAFGPEIAFLYGTSFAVLGSLTLLFLIPNTSINSKQ